MRKELWLLPHPPREQLSFAFQSPLMTFVKAKHNSSCTFPSFRPTQMLSRSPFLNSTLRVLPLSLSSRSSWLFPELLGGGEGCIERAKEKAACAPASCQAASSLPGPEFLPSSYGRVSNASRAHLITI